MREININIEGYNVNGICVGCLNYNRKMFYNDEVKECFKFLADIDVPDGLTIQVCWECLASVRASNRFQAQILRSYDVLIDYSQKHTFLNSPLDLSQYSNQRLTINSVDTNPPLLESKDEPKEEVEVEVKSEVDDDDKFDDKFDVDFELEVKKDNYAAETSLEVPVGLELKDESSDEDIQLSRLKRKKKKEKKGRRDKKRDRSKIKESKEDRSRNERKLKNLPPDLVELYTMTEEEMWQQLMKVLACSWIHFKNLVLVVNRVRSEDLANREFINLKYKCTDCIIKFNSEKLMVDHMKGKHKPKSEDCQQCDVCKAYFLTKDNLSVHRALHRVAFRCVSCNSLSTLKRVMLSHAREHGPAGAFICNLCDEAFITKSKLTYHKNMCHQERPQCDCCGKVFANKMTLKYHLKILPQNREDKPKEKLYIPCKGCSKIFHSKKSYRAHVVIHDGLTYPCPTCGKQFQWKRNLARHARNHRDRERGTSHECRECHKTFSSRDCYNNHMRLSKRHAREESLSHECHFCGKKFATKWCMTDHIDWDHLKRVKYQCNVCFKAFKTAKIMVAHINNIHEGKKKEPEGEHLCEICGKSYKTVKRLKGHVWAMHTNRSNTKRFKCKLCPATFTWQTSIYKHTKMMHDDTKRNKVPRPVKKQESFVDMQQVRMQYIQVPPLVGTVPNTTIIHNIV